MNAGAEGGATAAGRRWVRTLEELEGGAGATRQPEVDDAANLLEAPDGVTRRGFLQVMGASLALATAAGCTWEEETLLPLERNVDGRTAGVPARYATAWEQGGHARGLVVTCYEGRPVKAEGNPLHPTSRGATDVFGQALVLALYDPDRSRSPARNEGGRLVDESWDDFVAFAGPHWKELRASGGEGLRILAEASSSPTRARLRARLAAALPKAVWHEWEPVSRDQERAGAMLAFGRSLRTHWRLEKAKVVVGIDADVLEGHPAALANARALAAARRPEAGDPARVYALESRMTLLGALADHRLPTRSEQAGPLLGAVADAVRALLEKREVAAAPDGFLAEERVAKLVKALAQDLAAARGASAVVVGPTQPAPVHAAAHRLNALLENVGQTMYYTADADGDRPPHAASIRALVEACKAGAVKSLVMLGGNPVYDAPVDLKFGEALAAAGTSIHLSPVRDETSRAATRHVNRAHPFEAWGDLRAWDGTLSVAQPLVEPLFGGRTAEALLSLVIGDKEPEGPALFRATYDAAVSHGVSVEETERRWRRALHDGVVPATALPEERPALVAAPAAAAWDARATSALAPVNGALEITYYADPKVWDGRWANSAWLQEVPDFLTKLTWDNALLVSPETARRLGVAQGTLVTLETGGRSLEVAAYVMPGQAAGSLALALGYGRTAAGRVGGFFPEGTATVGFDAYRLRASASLDGALDAKVTPTGREYKLALTQNHHQIDDAGLRERERRVGELIREAPLAHWKEHPDFAKHRVHEPKALPLWQEHSYAEGHRWGMTVDLGSCIGCNACAVACQAENNIPVVGKEQVSKGREMPWIRLDRYFAGDPESPAVAVQPVLCQHCENAPCEQVCPVAATVHTAEGLNDMVYNRCVGTRYCSNNCPYKVRRFNYFNYWRKLPGASNEPLTLLFNPDVTVRSRGVMEKCTFCTQRISGAKIASKNAQRPIKDGDIVPACAQVCPTEAIVFGDLNDKESAVAKRAASPRAYAMLGELNVRPRVSYLARVTNPHEALAAPAAETTEKAHHG